MFHRSLGFNNAEQYKKKYAERKFTITQKSTFESTLSFFLCGKRTVASYFQVSFVRIYCVHRRSSGGSVLIVRVYIRRIFRLKILNFISRDSF